MIKEIVTESAECWIFTHDEKSVIHSPQCINGIASKFGYPSNLTAVCMPTEADAEAEILRLNLIDPRND
jgi:hypothetical protein